MTSNYLLRNFKLDIKLSGIIHWLIIKKKDMSLVRKHAPNFEAPAWVHNDFKTLKLSDFKGKYLVLFFYPLDFTFVCPTEIIAFSNKAK